MNLKQIRLVGVCFVIVLAVSGCGGPAPAPAQPGPAVSNPAQPPSPQAVKPNYTPAPGDSYIFFLEPVDGDSVSPSLSVRYGVTRLNLAGKRVYLTIDHVCAAAGETLTTDQSHLMFELARSSLPVKFGVGPHRLCLQVTDDKGVVLDGPGMLQVIDIVGE
jgi:hypothetical protein